MLGGVLGVALEELGRSSAQHTIGEFLFKIKKKHLFRDNYK